MQSQQLQSWKLTHTIHAHDRIPFAGVCLGMENTHRLNLQSGGFTYSHLTCTCPECILVSSDSDAVLKSGSRREDVGSSTATEKPRLTSTVQRLIPAPMLPVRPLRAHEAGRKMIKVFDPNHTDPASLPPSLHSDALLHHPLPFNHAEETDLLLPLLLQGLGRNRGPIVPPGFPIVPGVITVASRLCQRRATGQSEGQSK